MAGPTAATVKKCTICASVGGTDCHDSVEILKNAIKYLER